MLEVVGVEVGAEPLVQDAQDVEVELGGDAGRVVVGGVEPGRVLDQVDPDQEAVAGGEDVAAADRKKAGSSSGCRLPIVPARKSSSRPPPGPERREVVQEVPDDPAHGGLRVVAPAARPTDSRQVALADLEQDDALERAARAHGVEEQADLAARARAELGELGGPDGLHDRGGVGLENARSRCGSGSTRAAR